MVNQKKSFQIATHSRYMSVSSRKIGNKEWLCSRKISTTNLPQDRVSFYAHMVGLLMHNSQEHSLGLDLVCIKVLLVFDAIVCLSLFFN